MENIYKFKTRLIHNKYKYDPINGAVSVPIQHASTYHQFNIDEFGKYDYSRSQNPTREALEEIIAELEGGIRGFAFSSGMAAISTAFLILSSGDHIIVPEDVYGGTYRLLTTVLNRLGIEHSFVDMTNLEQVKSAVKTNTKAIYIETPSNPTLKVTNIKEICDFAKTINAITYVDNTFLTPALQRPLELGADIVLHSATKFLSGHSDVVAGLAVVKDENLAKQLGALQNSIGAVLGVQDAWLVMRGLKTLSIRMEHSQRNAERLANYLVNHPLVKKVYYPGLENHPQYEIQKMQAKGAGAVLSFELCGEKELRSFIKEIKLPVFAVSLGAVETIISYPTKMSHAAMPASERKRRGISDSLLRVSVGLEDIDDIINDFEKALSF